MAQVVQSKADDKEGYTALQLGIGSKRPKQVNGTQIGHFNAAGVPIKRKLQEFRISEVNISAALGGCITYRNVWLAAGPGFCRSGGWR